MEKEQFSLVQNAQDYLKWMISSVEGSKVIVLDPHTLPIFSTLLPKSYALEKQVFLCIEISKVPDCVVKLENVLFFIRPNNSNIQHLEVIFRKQLVVEASICSLLIRLF